jgi:hypothetical protein
MHPDFGEQAGNHTIGALLSRMVRLPLMAVVYGMEMFVKTVHGLQTLTGQSVEALTGTAGPPPSPPAAAPAPAPPAATAPGNSVRTTEEVTKEQRKMPDTNLNDDMLKLVRYKILFIKRDYEVAFTEQEDLVYDNMDDTAFTAWKIAEFIQALDHTPIPKRWEAKSYPRKDPGGMIHKLPEDDKKFLRVYYEVMQRYVREKFKADERKVEVLEKIESILDHRLPK